MILLAGALFCESSRKGGLLALFYLLSLRVLLSF